MPPGRRIEPKSPDLRALGEAIEELRGEASLTHEQLAEKLEMSFQRISELERGISNPTFQTLLRLVDGLDVKLSDLAERVDRNRAS
jgi:transcriptional regulator with XRE-family HTH domain